MCAARARSSTTLHPYPDLAFSVLARVLFRTGRDQSPAIFSSPLAGVATQLHSEIHSLVRCLSIVTMDNDALDET